MSENGTGTLSLQHELHRTRRNEYGPESVWNPLSNIDTRQWYKCFGKCLLNKATWLRTLHSCTSASTLVSN